MTVYISGPITNNKLYLFDFSRAEKELRNLGYNVYNPVTIGRSLKTVLGREPTYDEYMEQDFEYIKQSDAIYMLPGWENSKGAIAEHDYAVKNNISILKIKTVGGKWR